MRNSDLPYCGQQVRLHDPNRFLISMFMPSETHEALWALFAFNHEIAKTREVVTETQLGLIRLQWWREHIEKIYTNQEIVSNEVINALAKAIAEYDLPKAEFEQLIYAREFDLEDVLPGNLEGMINYADFTNTSLLNLAVRITGGEPDLEPVQPIAVNYGLAGLLKSVVFHAKQRRCYLPEDALKQQEVLTNQLYELKPQVGVPHVVEQICAQIVPDIETDHKLLKLFQKMAVMTIYQLKKCGYDPLHPKFQIPPAFQALRLFLALHLPEW